MDTRLPLSILLVEDNPADARICLWELEKAGLEVNADVVQSLKDFTERLNAKSYDIVLADQNLPGWTGMDALAALRSLEKEIPFILITGSLGEEAAVDCIKQGASDYVLKGRLARLHVAVRRVLEERTVRDERERLKVQLSQAQRMEAIGRLAGGIAHDFNNHLGIIIGQSELLMDRLGGDESSLRRVGLIREASLRAAALTQQLLAFSRRQVLEPTILDLNTVIADLGKMLTPLIGENIELATSLDPALGKVRADTIQIDQIIMNLTINARDAMPQGGRLTIETMNVQLDESYAKAHPVVSPGWYVMLAVSDTGMGMDSETQSHMFEPFFTTKGKGTGTGLGLATVYGIVKQSMGYIWAYSELGKGTTFKIYLPRVEGEVPARELQGISPVHRGAGETVLVVEDEGMLRELSCEFLRACGYTVLEAGDGPEAIELSRQRQGPIHLLLTDAVMPKMSGRELAHQLFADRPEMKVLVVSGYTDDTALRNGLLEPRTAFLQKPLTRDSLLRKVRDVLDGGKGGW
jgi:signal transduction histidine kinase